MIMILTGNKISQEVEQGNIIINPFNNKLINPNSYNYRLGDYLVEVNESPIDSLYEPYTNIIEISKQGFMLKPKKLYLGSTYEMIGSDKYVPILIGRSSLGRLGLFLQITSDLGHIGTMHNWTLELTVVQPLIIYIRMKIGQVSFWYPEGLGLLNGELYRNKSNSYSQYLIPQIFMPHKFIDHEK